MLYTQFADIIYLLCMEVVCAALLMSPNVNYLILFKWITEVWCAQSNNTIHDTCYLINMPNRPGHIIHNYVCRLLWWLSSLPVPVQDHLIVTILVQQGCTILCNHYMLVLSPASAHLWVVLCSTQWNTCCPPRWQDSYSTWSISWLNAGWADV